MPETRKSSHCEARHLLHLGKQKQQPTRHKMMSHACNGMPRTSFPDSSLGSENHGLPLHDVVRSWRGIDALGRILLKAYREKVLNVLNNTRYATIHIPSAMLVCQR